MQIKTRGKIFLFVLVSHSFEKKFQFVDALGSPSKK